jgi:hypothetical protein
VPASAARALAFVDEHGTTAASLDWTAADLATGGLELGLGAADTVQTNNSLERMLGSWGTCREARDGQNPGPNTGSRAGAAPRPPTLPGLRRRDADPL